MHGAHQNIRSVEKISLENVGREANDSNESHEDLASFQVKLNNREREMRDSRTNNSRAVHLFPQVCAEPLIGAAHLLGPKSWGGGSVSIFDFKELMQVRKNENFTGDKKT